MTIAAVRREALDGIALIGKVNWTPQQIARLRKLAEAETTAEKLNACLALCLGDPAARAFIQQQVEDLRAMVEPKTKQQEWLDRLEAFLQPPEPPEPPEIELDALTSLNDLTRSCELAVIRRLGKEFQRHEEAIAKLVESENAEFARDAAVALELIGTDAIRRVLDRGPVRAAYSCADPSADSLRAIFNTLQTDLDDEERADWILQLARMRLKNDEIVELTLRECLRHRNDRVRAYAIWGLGNSGSRCRRRSPTAPWRSGKSRCPMCRACPA